MSDRAGFERHGRWRCGALVGAALAATTAPPAAAQQQSQVQQVANDTLAAGTALGSDKSDAQSAETQPAEKKKMKPDLLVVPIPMSNPTLGAGLTVAAVMFYNPNGSKEPWVTGGGAFYTSNKSWGGGLVHSMSLADDRFKVLMFGGYADINMNFYGIGANAGKRDVSVKMDDKGTMGLLQGQYELVENFYVGGRYQFLKINSQIKRENPIFPDLNLPKNLLDSQISGIGPSITYDSRDNQFAPRKGVNVTLVGLFNIKGLGSDFSYNKWQLAANALFPVTKTGTLVLHGGMCAVSKGGPFYDLCMYGMGGDLRGYEMGRYRDRASWATQAEWRQHLGGKFGAVFFAGVGGIAKDLGDIGNTTSMLLHGQERRSQLHRRCVIPLIAQNRARHLPGVLCQPALAHSGNSGTDTIDPRNVARMTIGDFAPHYFQHSRFKQ